MSVEEPARLLLRVSQERWPSWWVVEQESKRPVPEPTWAYQAQRWFLALGSEQR